MLAHGNGTRQQCTANLIKTIRGEVPFERTKGIDRRIIDSPSVYADTAKADVAWLISTYEPRVHQFTTTLTNEAENGAFGIHINVIN